MDCDKIRTWVGQLRHGRFKKDSLTGKMVQRFLRGLGVGIFLILICYYGGRNMLRQYFISSGFFYHAESGRIEELQSYVTENELAATDYSAVRAWGEERNIQEFTIFRDDRIIFDISYAEDVYVDAKRSGLNSWRVYYTVSFADGDALVYLYDGEAETYYHILLALSVLGGFIACMAIFISGMQEDVQYIQILENEVKGIRAGDLKSPVMIQGEDELASLALGLDQMRRSLKEKEETEAELRKTQEEMRKAQEKLVLGMSHDLRTPLTGLMTYMEIIKKQEADGKPDPVYIEKAYDKILQIKTLSDQMFEFFLIDSQKESELEPPEDVFSVFGDYLSELCGVLDAKGYHIDADGLVWESVSVRINTDYMGRIMNNIISNIEKYADKDQNITVSVSCGNDHVDISIGNKILGTNPYVEGTGIGVKNISMMMRQMDGTSRVAMSEDSYCITLSFPAVRGEAIEG